MDNINENGGVQGNGELPAQDSTQPEGTSSEGNQVNSEHTMNGDSLDAGGQGIV